MMKADFAKFINEYLTQYIRLADTKATIMLGVLGGLMGILLGHLDAPGARLATTGVGLGLTLIAILLQVVVVWPRTGFRKREGLVFWENIAAWDLDEYRHQLEAADDARILRELANQAHNLGRTADRKYIFLRWGLVATVVAVGVDLVVLIRF